MQNTLSVQMNLDTDKQPCPHCGSLVWEQIRRTRIQKVLHPNKGRCYCRTCQREFWKKAG